MTQQSENSGYYQSTLSAFEAAALKLVLAGDSIVDWKYLPLDSLPAARQLLKINGYDLEDPLDRDHLTDMYREAVLYLTDIHGYHMPLELEHSEDLLRLFSWASKLEEASPELETLSGMLLKVISVLNYLSARELLFRLPISEEELNSRLSAKIFSQMEHLQHNTNLVEFATGQKSRSSMLSKLLIKAETQASHIFDVIRCRIVVENKSDLLPALLFLLNNLIPFNYISPGESKNNLIPLQLIRPYDHMPSEERILSFLDSFSQRNSHSDAAGRLNEFSGPTFRSINFIASIPLRVDEILEHLDPTIAEDFGRVILTQMEIQLLDRQTAIENESGANSHRAYKSRQLQRIRQRIEVARDPDLPPLERTDLDSDENSLATP